MNTPHVTIRSAIPADAPALANLYHQLVDSPHINVLPERLAEVCTSTHTRVFVAESQQQIIGSILVCLCDDIMFQRQPFAVLENIVVAQTARGQGVGRRLLQTAEEFCMASGCSKILLLSSVERTEAHRFFEKFGFSGVRKRGFVKYRSQCQ